MASTQLLLTSRHCITWNVDTRQIYNQKDKRNLEKEYEFAAQSAQTASINTSIGCPDDTYLYYVVLQHSYDWVLKSQEGRKPSGFMKKTLSKILWNTKQNVDKNKDWGIEFRED